MPLLVPTQSSLPVYDSLVAERVPVMDLSRAEHQDIRPLRIGLFNLMPTVVQEKTEIQFFRLLGNSPLQITPVLLRFEGFVGRAARERMEVFYEPWHTVRKTGLDGLIVTGANLERRGDGSLREFGEIHYADEWREVLDWAREFVTSTIYSCLACHFALQRFYGIERRLSPAKVFGVFDHSVSRETHPEFLQGMNDVIPIPHSRWGDIPVASD